MDGERLDQLERIAKQQGPRPPATVPQVDRLLVILKRQELQATRHGRLLDAARQRLERHLEGRACCPATGACRYPPQIRETIARHTGALEAIQAGLLEVLKWK
ncbi:MAG: hypothetical protein V3S03_08495 [Vicinamibacteria bacterium]